MLYELFDVANNCLLEHEQLRLTSAEYDVLGAYLVRHGAPLSVWVFSAGETYQRSVFARRKSLPTWDETKATAAVTSLRSYAALARILSERIELLTSRPWPPSRLDVACARDALVALASGLSCSGVLQTLRYLDDSLVAVAREYCDEASAVLFDVVPDCSCVDDWCCDSVCEPTLPNCECPDPTMVDVTVPANASLDDCLQAVVDEYVAEHPELSGWDLSPRWEDDRTRETVVLTVPVSCGS